MSPGYDSGFARLSLMLCAMVVPTIIAPYTVRSATAVSLAVTETALEPATAFCSGDGDCCTESELEVDASESTVDEPAIDGFSESAAPAESPAYADPMESAYAEGALGTEDGFETAIATAAMAAPETAAPATRRVFLALSNMSARNAELTVFFVDRFRRPPPSPVFMDTTLDKENYTILARSSRKLTVDAPKGFNVVRVRLCGPNASQQTVQTAQAPAPGLDPDGYVRNSILGIQVEINNRADLF